MKLAIIGAAGVRTPLLINAISARQNRLNLDKLALMDIDAERLELIGALTSPIEDASQTRFRIIRTTDAAQALKNADFVITTFRVGGIEARIIDERVPLNHGVLGQETTGPGGFAMGLRSIPVLMKYIDQIGKHCPDAWLINFANPSGMLTEAVFRYSNMERVVGICDAPYSMQKIIASILGISSEEIFIDYFGLNHLGWIKGIRYQDRDFLPGALDYIKNAGDLPGFRFNPDLITSLGLIPNEYLYYFYNSKQAVESLLNKQETRGELLLRLNNDLFNLLRQKHKLGDLKGMTESYLEYLSTRHATYMQHETSGMVNSPQPLTSINQSADSGYAEVALNLIEGLMGKKSSTQILNIPNRTAISGMEPSDVVEIPAFVTHNHIQPFAIGDVPGHCLGLMKQVKNFEHLTIKAALEGTYQKALLALTLHPLVRDFSLGKIILDEYIQQHEEYFCFSDK